MPYKIDGALPPELLTEVEPGTNLLVSGPAMSGKRQLLLKLLARGESEGEGSVVVTSRNPAADVVDAYQDVRPSDGHDFLRIIDCVGDATEVEGARVHGVSSPGDLTGIGIEFSEIAREAEEADLGRVRVGFDSLSPLLMYVDLQRLFRFLHVFTSQIQSRDWLGLFAIDPDSHDQQEVNTISQLFDGMVEIRLADGGGREARVRGVTDAPTDWVALD
ncbi:KaiC/GvpD/RAD55 family RecA-like ATPase [Halarchaeum rubridurum]|nr:hypothetical protein [Halarchaeum rubridurum]MBP1955498.1 KaiC/GvpD/RAD55 family RecA-like ATPase [Halarchaeum rubridurum]